MTTIPMSAAVGLALSALLGLGGWLLAQSRDPRTGLPRKGTTRLGTLLVLLGLLGGVMALPEPTPPSTYALLLGLVLLSSLLLLRSASRRALGWTSTAEAATTAVALAWSTGRRALIAACCAAAGLALAGWLAAQGAPLAAVLGALVVLAPARWWMGAAWKREQTRTLVERALAGMLSGGEEWKAEEADKRSAPVVIWFDADQVPVRVVCELPPRWAASKREELEAEVTERLEDWGDTWLCTPKASSRMVTITRSSALPTKVPYAAQHGARRQITIGPARVPRAGVKAGLGEFGSAFDFVWDVKRSPHGLIVGLTGGGKSGTAYVVITTWCRAGNEVVLLDPKRVEFTPLRGRQGVTRVETDLALIAEALEAQIGEMERRYTAMARCRARNVFRLPEGQRPTPLLIVVDEVFELLAKRGGTDDETKEINAMKARCASAISNIAALGRAADVHLLLLCQRADRAVVEGSLQNNLSFKLLCDPASTEPTERHMIGLQEVPVDMATAGRAVAKTIGVPESELQVLWLDEDDLDRWLPVTDEAAAVRPVPLGKSDVSKVLVPADEAAGPVSIPEPMSEGEAWAKAERKALSQTDPDCSNPSDSAPDDAEGHAPESAPKPGRNPQQSRPGSGSSAPEESGETPPQIDWDYMKDFGD